MHHTLPHAGASIAFSLPTSLISIASLPWPVKKFPPRRHRCRRGPRPALRPFPQLVPDRRARASTSAHSSQSLVERRARRPAVYPEIAGMCQPINAQTGLDDHIITGRGLAPACPIRHLLSHIWSLASVDGREVI